MKFQVQSVAALVLISGASAFSPSVRPVPTRAAPAGVDLSLAKNDSNDVDMDLGKAAMSFMVASMIAASSTNPLLPIEPAFAAATPAATTTTTTTTTTKKAAEPKKVAEPQKAAETPKEAAKKLAPEEKNKIEAKKNLDLAERTLKEYTKIASEAKSTDSKASNALKSQEKVTADAKKAFLAVSDKLSAAKNQKMPQTAIKELSEKTGE